MVVYNLLGILELLPPESKLWVKIKKVKFSTAKKSIFSSPGDCQLMADKTVNFYLPVILFSVWFSFVIFSCKKGVKNLVSKEKMGGRTYF